MKKNICISKKLLSFIAGAVDTADKHFETARMGYSGAQGKLIHEKNWSQKSRVRLPLSRLILPSSFSLILPCSFSRYIPPPPSLFSTSSFLLLSFPLHIHPALPISHSRSPPHSLSFSFCCFLLFLLPSLPPPISSLFFSLPLLSSLLILFPHLQSFYFPTFFSPYLCPLSSSSLLTVTLYHKVHIIKSTTVYVPSSESGLSHPLSRQRVCPSAGNQGGGGAHSPAGEGLGSPNSIVWRKNLITLPTLCSLFPPFSSLSTSPTLLFLYIPSLFLCISTHYKWKRVAWFMLISFTNQKFRPSS